MKRYEKNPIIVPQDIESSSEKLKVIGVFNAGAAHYDNKYFLIARVAESPKILKDENYYYFAKYNDLRNKIEVDKISREYVLDDTDPRTIVTTHGLLLTSISHFKIFYSEDGYNFKLYNKMPYIFPDQWYEEFGIEDPRITFIDDRYYITYTAVNRYGMAVALMETRDFINFKKHGIILLPDNKDVVIFPEKINNKYVAFTRPMSVFDSFMWLSYSHDLKFWGGHRFFASSTKNHWENKKIGASAVPFLTEKGWVEIYHGVSQNDTYSLGYFLLDKDDPGVILKRSQMPILKPETIYEREGFFGDTIFLCGAIRIEDKVYIYYSGCDENISLAIADIDFFIE